MTSLKEIWFQLSSRYTKDLSLVKKLWDEIETQYTTKNRFYHTLEHIQFMIELARQNQDKIFDWDTLIYSIFYHDIVYKALRKDNEEKSAQLAQIRLHQIGVPSHKIHKCAVQIMATKHHGGNGDHDTELFLDFDLAILGMTSEVYKVYSQQIRKEFSNLPQLIYRFGRKKVLKHFLDKETIYYTKDFQNKFEVQAKLNLKGEMESL